MLMLLAGIVGSVCVFRLPPNHEFYWSGLLPVAPEKVSMPLGALLLAVSLWQERSNRRRTRPAFWPPGVAIAGSAFVVVSWLLYGGVLG